VINGDTLRWSEVVPACRPDFPSPSPRAFVADASTALRVDPGADDAALVAAARAGARDAFDVLVERHRRIVYRVCYRFVNNHGRVRLRPRRPAAAATPPHRITASRSHRLMVVSGPGARGTVANAMSAPTRADRRRPREQARQVGDGAAASCAIGQFGAGRCREANFFRAERTPLTEVA
jgi:hypothetical protein